MAQSVLVVSGSGELVSELRSALDAAGKEEWTLDRAPSAALAVRILAAAGKEISVVVVDLAELAEAEALVTELATAQATTPVFAAALGGASDAQPLVEGLRYRVFRRVEDLPAMLSLEQPQEAPSRAARLVLFAPAQDGAGASATALHVAAILVQDHGLRTLFVELDYHSDSVACRLRLKKAKSLADLEPGQDWRAAVTQWNGLHLLAAPASSRILRKRGLPDLAGTLARTGEDYDVVIGDLPCNTAVAPRSVLASAEKIFVVATPEVTSLHLARRRVLQLTAVGARPEGIRLILNRDRPGAVDSEVARQVTGLDPACRLPNEYAAASEAEMEGRAVASASALGLAYARLALDIAGKAARAAEPQESRWSRLLAAWR